MPSNYIPHGYRCDFDLMCPDDGETYVTPELIELVKKTAKKEGTYLVEVMDCEGAFFCIAPLPIARWICRIMNKQYDIIMNIDDTTRQKFQDEFKVDWELRREQ